MAFILLICIVLKRNRFLLLEKKKSSFVYFLHEMDFFVAGTLTSSGRARLEDEEVELCIASRVTLKDQKNAVIGKDGSCIVTTHYLWWWTSSSPPIKIHVKSILKAEGHHSIFRREPWIDLFLATDPQAPLIKVVFSGNECGEYLARLETSIQRQAWTQKKLL